MSMRIPTEGSAKRLVMRGLAVFSCGLILAIAARAEGPTFSGTVSSESANPDFKLSDTNGEDWAIEGDEPVANAFAVSHGAGFTVHPLVIEHGAPESSLYINSIGQIGIGTSVPLGDLRIKNRSPSGSVSIHLEETMGTDQTWSIGADSDEFRLIDNDGSPTDRLTIATSGSSTLKLGGASIELAVAGLGFSSLILDQTGVSVTGSVIQLSSRDSKTDFGRVEPRAVLAKVAELPLAYWRYKTEDESVRHLGPMADDFQAAFALGADDQGIAMLDAGGVALAAIQGLKAEQDELMAAKDRELAALRNELVKLRELVSRMAAASR